MAETIRSALKQAASQLHGAGIASAALDARLLLQDVLDVDHAALIADPHRRLTDEQQARLAALVARREAHEPVSRILGWREFYGRCFTVTRAVLDPRPDSETLIDAALQVSRRKPVASILDLGTGSGILALTLLAEMPNAHAIATDRSAAALAVARENAQQQGVASRLRLYESDWWHGVAGRFDLVVSNPPYIASAEIAGLEAGVRDHDPLLALDGGRDGLDCYRAIAAGAANHLQAEGVILLEIGAGQADRVKEIFFANRFKALNGWADLGGHIRVLGFEPDLQRSSQKMI